MCSLCQEHVCSAMYKPGCKQACRRVRSESPPARGQTYLGYPGTTDVFGLIFILFGFAHPSTMSCKTVGCSEPLFLTSLHGLDGSPHMYFREWFSAG